MCSSASSRLTATGRGSTARSLSVGAMTTHANFLSNTETARRVISLPDEPGLRQLVSVPLFHVTGCNSQLLVAC